MTNDELRLRLHSSQAGPSIHASGHLDSSNVDNLLRVMAAAMMVRGATVICLDLSKIAYLEASAVRSLLDCRRQALQRGLGFAIVAISAPAMAALVDCHAFELLPKPQTSAACATPRMRPRRGRSEAPRHRFCAMTPLLYSRRYF